MMIFPYICLTLWRHLLYALEWQHHANRVKCVGVWVYDSSRDGHQSCASCLVPLFYIHTMQGTELGGLPRAFDYWSNPANLPA